MNIIKEDITQFAVGVNVVVISRRYPKGAMVQLHKKIKGTSCWKTVDHEDVFYLTGYVLESEIKIVVPIR